MKYYNVLVLILFILIMAVCTSSCTPIKTKHYITIDHNINIKIDVNKPININDQDFSLDILDSLNNFFL